MSFVPSAAFERLNSRLHGVPSLKYPVADHLVTLRVEAFSCRKVPRRSDEVPDESEPDIKKLVSETSISPTALALLTAGERMQSFARTTSHLGDDDETRENILDRLPHLCAVMNALYRADGYDFDGVVDETSFELFHDPFAMEEEINTLLRSMRPNGIATTQHPMSPSTQREGENSNPSSWTQEEDSLAQQEAQDTVRSLWKAVTETLCGTLYQAAVAESNPSGSGIPLPELGDFYRFTAKDLDPQLCDGSSTRVFSPTDRATPGAFPSAPLEKKTKIVASDHYFIFNKRQRMMIVFVICVERLL